MKKSISFLLILGLLFFSVSPTYAILKHGGGSSKSGGGTGGNKSSGGGGGGYSGVTSSISVGTSSSSGTGGSPSYSAPARSTGGSGGGGVEPCKFCGDDSGGGGGGGGGSIKGGTGGVSNTGIQAVGGGNVVEQVIYTIKGQGESRGNTQISVVGQDLVEYRAEQAQSVSMIQQFIDSASSRLSPNNQTTNQQTAADIQAMAAAQREAIDKYNADMGNLLGGGTYSDPQIVQAINERILTETPRGVPNTRYTVEETLNTINDFVQSRYQVNQAIGDANPELLGNNPQAQAMYNKKLEMRQPSTNFITSTIECLTGNDASCRDRDNIGRNLDPATQSRLVVAATNAVNYYGDVANRLTSRTDAEREQYRIERAGELLDQNLRNCDETCRQIGLQTAADEGLDDFYDYMAGKQLEEGCRGDAGCLTIIQSVPSYQHQELLAVSNSIPKSITQKDQSVAPVQVAAETLEVARATTANVCQGSSSETCGVFENLDPERQREILFNPSTDLIKILDLDPQEVRDLRSIATQTQSSLADGFASGRLEPIEDNELYNRFRNSLNGQPANNIQTRTPQENVELGLVLVGEGEAPKPGTINFDKNTLYEGWVFQNQEISTEQVARTDLNNLPIARFAASNPVVAGRIDTTLNDAVTIGSAFVRSGQSVASLVLPGRNVPAAISEARQTSSLNPITEAIAEPYQISNNPFVIMSDAFNTIRENRQPIIQARQQNGTQGVREVLTDRGNQVVANRVAQESCNSSTGACTLWQAYDSVTEVANNPAAPREAVDIRLASVTEDVLNLEARKANGMAIDGASFVGSFIGGLVAPSGLANDLVVGQGSNAITIALKQLLLRDERDIEIRNSQQYLQNNQNTISPQARDFIQNNMQDLRRERRQDFRQELTTQIQIGGLIDVAFAGAGDLLGRGLGALGKTESQAAQEAADAAVERISSAGVERTSAVNIGVADLVDTIEGANGLRTYVDPDGRISTIFSGRNGLTRTATASDLTEVENLINVSQAPGGEGETIVDTLLTDAEGRVIGYRSIPLESRAHPGHEVIGGLNAVIAQGDEISDAADALLDSPLMRQLLERKKAAQAAGGGVEARVAAIRGAMEDTGVKNVGMIGGSERPDTFANIERQAGALRQAQQNLYAKMAREAEAQTLSGRVTSARSQFDELIDRVRGSTQRIDAYTTQNRSWRGTIGTTLVKQDDAVLGRVTFSVSDEIVPYSKNVPYIRSTWGSGVHEVPDVATQADMIAVTARDLTSGPRGVERVTVESGLVNNNPDLASQLRRLGFVESGGSLVYTPATSGVNFLGSLKNIAGTLFGTN